MYCGRTVRSSQRRFPLKKLFLKISHYPQETPVSESPFKNVAGLKACNFIKKRPQHRCFVKIAKFLILLNSKNNCERLPFDFFNGLLLHRPKGSRFRLYDGVRFQGPTHRSSFLFLSFLYFRVTIADLQGNIYLDGFF